MQLACHDKFPSRILKGRLCMCRSHWLISSSQWGVAGVAMGQVGAELGPSWSQLGSSWGQVGIFLGPSWAPIGPIYQISIWVLCSFLMKSDPRGRVSTEFFFKDSSKI